MQCARVVELADSLASGASALHGRAGSSPVSGTIHFFKGLEFYRSLKRWIFLLLKAFYNFDFFEFILMNTRIAKVPRMFIRTVENQKCYANCCKAPQIAPYC